MGSSKVVRNDFTIFELLNCFKHRMLNWQRFLGLVLPKSLQCYLKTKVMQFESGLSYLESVAIYSFSSILPVRP